MSKKLTHFVPRYGGAIKGLPARSFTITNSERMTLACDRKWLHSYGERLSPKETARPLRYGTAWADFQEDVHLWW